MVQQGFPGRRQGHALGLAHKQTNPERFLQLHQALAGRRHRDRFSRGSTGQRALFVDSDEQLEGDQVEAADQAFCSMVGSMASSAESAG